MRHVTLEEELSAAGETARGRAKAGEEVDPKTGQWFDSISPSTEEPLFEVALAGEEDVALAVDTARDAFQNGWSELAPSERAKYLFRIARIIQERAREIAVL